MYIKCLKSQNHLNLSMIHVIQSNYCARIIFTINTLAQLGINDVFNYQLHYLYAQSAKIEYYEFPDVYAENLETNNKSMRYYLALANLSQEIHESIDYEQSNCSEASNYQSTVDSYP